MTVQGVSARIESKRETFTAQRERQAVPARLAEASIFTAAERPPITRLTSAPEMPATRAVVAQPPSLRSRVATWLDKVDNVRAWQRFDPALSVSDPLVSPHVDHFGSILKGTAYGLGYLAFPLGGAVIANSLKEDAYFIKPAAKRYAFAMATSVARGVKIFALTIPAHAAMATARAIVGRP